MFKVQISNPKANEIRNPSDTSLDEAIESIFPLDNEYAFINWNHIYIPISYKYDISVMLKDILMMIEELSMKKEGKIKINWPSNTFSSSWTIDFDFNNIKIDTIWHNVLGNLKDLLNENSILEIERKEFIDKWMALLLFIKIKLERAGYNSSNLGDFSDLDDITGGG